MKRGESSLLTPGYAPLSLSAESVASTLPVCERKN